MKKEYVKPVIESEEFVANEYVAGCWEVYCKGSPGILNWFAHTEHKVVEERLQEEPNFSFSIFGTDFWQDSSGNYHYHVTKTNHATAEHPNAS